MHPHTMKIGLRMVVITSLLLVLVSLDFLFVVRYAEP